MKINGLGLLAAVLVAAGSFGAVASPQDPLTPQAEPAPKPCEPPASRANTASNSTVPGCQSNGVIKPPQTGDRSVLAPPEHGLDARHPAARHPRRRPDCEAAVAGAVVLQLSPGGAFPMALVGPATG